MRTTTALRYFAFFPLEKGVDRSASPLTPAFALGWNKLPMEIRLHIISFNTRNIADEHNPYKFVGVGHQDQIRHKVLKYSLASPEFGALAQETIYTHNTFFIDCLHKRKLYLPPVSFRGMIRRLNIDADLMTSYGRSLRMIERLSTGLYGFESIQFLGLTFLMDDHSFDLIRKGDLVFQKWNLKARRGQMKVVLADEADDDLMCALQQALGNITFGLHM
jgi:hypothetical protein